MKHIKAYTLSVILSDSDSCHVYVKVSKQDCNLTLRLDRGDSVELCGYPIDWLLHDHEDWDIIPSHYEAEVTVADECRILKQLLKSVLEQFNDPQWNDYCSKTKQDEVIKQINNKINSLQDLY